MRAFLKAYSGPSFETNKFSKIIVTESSSISMNILSLITLAAENRELYPIKLQYSLITTAEREFFLDAAFNTD